MSVRGTKRMKWNYHYDLCVFGTTKKQRYMCFSSANAMTW